MRKNSFLLIALCLAFWLLLGPLGCGGDSEDTGVTGDFEAAGEAEEDMAEQAPGGDGDRPSPGGGDPDKAPADGDGPPSDADIPPADPDLEPPPDGDLDSDLPGEAEGSEAADAPPDGDLDLDGEAEAETDGELEAGAEIDIDAEAGAEGEAVPEEEAEGEGGGRPPDVGELIITEIMANPTQVEDEFGEWIELYNAGPATLELSGCTLRVDAEQEAIADGTVLAPGGFFVFGNSADTDLNGEVEIDAEWGDWTLGDLGATIGLECGGGGTLIDEVTYDHNWPLMDGRALSLDLAAFDALANDLPENWCPAEASYGFGDCGTPGGDNFYCFIDGDVDAEKGAEFDGDRSELWPGAGDLLITEIMIDTDNLAENFSQWFEMQNLSERAVKVFGCSVSDSGHTSPITDDIAIEPGGFIVFGISKNLELNGGVTVDVDWGNWTLSGTGDMVKLSCGGATVDEVAFDTAWQITTGYSLTLDATGFWPDSNDNPIFWCNAKTKYHEHNYGTPGAANDICFVVDGDYERDRDGEFLVRPTGGEVVITELMVDPAGIEDSAGEWFEITNISMETFNLQGCEFADQFNSDWSLIDTPLFIEPGWRLVFGRNDNPATNDNVDVDFAWEGWEFMNDGGSVRIRCDLVVVDEVGYDSASVEEGRSLSLDPDHSTVYDNDDPEYWCAGDGLYGAHNHGTPGAANPDCP